MRIVGVVLSLKPALCTMVGMYTTAQTIITLASQIKKKREGAGGEGGVSNASCLEGTHPVCWCTGLVPGDLALDGSTDYSK